MKKNKEYSVSHILSFIHDFNFVLSLAKTEDTDTGFCDELKNDQNSPKTYITNHAFVNKFLSLANCQ